MKATDAFTKQGRVGGCHHQGKGWEAVLQLGSEKTTTPPQCFAVPQTGIPTAVPTTAACLQPRPCCLFFQGHGRDKGCGVGWIILASPCRLHLHFSFVLDAHPIYAHKMATGHRSASLVRHHPSGGSFPPPGLYLLMLCSGLVEKPTRKADPLFTYIQLISIGS